MIFKIFTLDINKMIFKIFTYKIMCLLYKTSLGILTSDIHVFDSERELCQGVRRIVFTNDMITMEKKTSHSLQKNNILQYLFYDNSNTYIENVIAKTNYVN